MDTILLTISFFINIILLLLVIENKIELKTIKSEIKKLNKGNKNDSYDEDTENDDVNVVYNEYKYDEYRYDRDVDEVCQNEENDESNTIVFCNYYDDNENQFNATVAVDIDNTFKNVHDFIDYVSDHNLHIVDIANRKVRKIKYLENSTYNNQETVLITFEDGKMAVFMPFLFAKYYHKEE